MSWPHLSPMDEILFSPEDSSDKYQGSMLFLVTYSFESLKILFQFLSLVTSTFENLFIKEIKYLLVNCLYTEAFVLILNDVELPYWRLSH